MDIHALKEMIAQAKANGGDSEVCICPLSSLKTSHSVSKKLAAVFGQLFTACLTFVKHL